MDWIGLDLVGRLRTLLKIGNHCSTVDDVSHKLWFMKGRVSCTGNRHPNRGIVQD